MLVQFGSTVLGDDTNAQGGGKLAFVLDDFALDSQVLVQPAYGAATPFKAPLGNVDGKIGFSIGQSFVSIDTMLTFLLTVYGLVNTTALLTIQGTNISRKFANAVLKTASRVPSVDRSVGVRLTMQYRFEINAIT